MISLIICYHVLVKSAPAWNVDESKTTEIRISPHNEVDAQFAYDEGEGDRSLDYWRDAHWRFFGRVCPKMDREVSETMPVVCERFRVIHRG